ncbi:MAG: right-handed parallel beta-helix repeat-containing protein [Planctomycetes bacterium]|nr:right-handed parallel beta-helix repeat-containing protein [Planctomycetota bacterium]
MAGKTFLKSTLAISLLLIVLTFSATAHAKIIYVDADAAGANNGSSWPDAFNYLQDALSDAYSGEEIHVAKGTYKPDQGSGVTPGDPEATFQLINGVTIKGGYAGLGEPDQNARNIQLYETILTGDLDGDDVDANDPRDLLDEPTRSENSYHVVTGSGTDETAVLDGFTITGGNSNGDFSPNWKGGGIRNYLGSPTLTNCTITRNSSWLEGGGMFNVGSPMLMLTNCTFSNNYSDYSGGGMYNTGRYSNVTLINCTFSGNFADYEGGGLYSGYSKYNSPKLTNCAFTGNTSGARAGGMYNTGDSTLTNCTFTGNSADWEAGGMFNDGSSPTLTNCTFIGNSAGENGGAIYNFGPFGTPTLTNCTFSNNSADNGGGIYCIHESNMTVTNCIMWGNMATQGNEIALNNFWDEGILYPATITVRYSDVEGGVSEVFVDTGCTLNWDDGNIDDDPCFVQPGYWDANGVWVDGDYHILADSPCVDAGDPNYIAEPNETDLDGRPRVIGGRIDMGAYEYMPSIPAEARILPRTINLASKGKWITCYIRLPEGYTVADIDPNSVFLQDEVKPESLLLNEQQQVATARFSREDVQPILKAGEVELKITGRLTDGTVFEGTDMIKVINKAGKK